MYVLLQMKLQPQLAEAVKKKFDEVLKAHAKEVAEFDKEFKQKSMKLAVTKDAEALNVLVEKRENLNLLSKKLSVNNIIRAAIERGLEVMDPWQMLDLIDENGSTRGRPRGS
jgi:hypothetical protein